MKSPRPELNSAILLGETSAVKSLLNENADPNYLDPTTQISPLHCAASISNEMVELLLNNGAISANQDIDGRTPLHYAAGRMSAKLIERMIQKTNVDVNCKDKEGYTALYYAIKSNRADNVEILLKNGASREVDELNNIVFHIAASLDTGDKVIETLLEYCPSIDLTKQNDHGQTPLDVAIGTTKENLNLMLQIRNRYYESEYEGRPYLNFHSLEDYKQFVEITTTRLPFCAKLLTILIKRTNSKLPQQDIQAVQDLLKPLYPENSYLLPPEISSSLKQAIHQNIQNHAIPGTHNPQEETPMKHVNVLDNQKRRALSF